MEWSAIALKWIKRLASSYEDNSVSLFLSLNDGTGAVFYLATLRTHGTMKNVQICMMLLTAIMMAVNGRVFYLPNMEENRYSDLAYPIPNEQSSRDLDLSFSAGDSNEFTENKIRPVKKLYTVVAAEKPFIEVNKEDLPVARYKLMEAPVRRGGSEDVFVVPELSRKTVKIDGNNKGEVILELRVIANHHDNN